MNHVEKGRVDRSPPLQEQFPCCATIDAAEACSASYDEAVHPSQEEGAAWHWASGNCFDAHTHTRCTLPRSWPLQIDHR